MSNTQNEYSGKKLKFTWTRFVKMGFHVWRQFDDPYYAGFAAQIAYFFLMSSIPMLILLTQVLGIFDVSVDFIRDWLEAHLSTQMSGFLQGLFSASSVGVTNILMVMLSLWASSSLAFSLSRLSTYTLSNGKYRFNFFTERAKSVFLALLSMTIAAASMVAYVYGEMIARRIFRSSIMEDIIGYIRTPILAMLFFVIILANYYLLPRIRVPVRAVLPGATVATLGIMIVTWIFSLYTERAVNYNILYGAFSNIVAMMLWFYLMSWVLCIGMMFNKSWDIHMRKGRLTEEKLRSYIYDQYGEKGAEMYNRLIIGEYDMYDPSLDTISVKFSRKLDPGYNEKREREIRELHEEERIRNQVERELRKNIEENIRGELVKEGKNSEESAVADDRKNG